MWHLLAGLIAGTVALLALASCFKGDAEREASLVVTGSSTMAPLVSRIAERYSREHPTVRIDVQSGGSSRGITDASQGRADIGMASRALFPEEKRGLMTTTIAFDGVAPVVHTSNPIEALDRSQLSDIFTGKIVNWAEVGGANEQIVVVQRADGRSEVKLFLSYKGLSSGAIRADAIAGENQQVVKTLTANPYAISYLSIGTSETEIDRGTPLKLLPLDGVPSTTEEVAAGRFPLARPLVLITPEGASEHVADFVDYAQSESVHDLVRAEAFVPAR